jgi:hypothetical protein
MDSESPHPTWEALSYDILTGMHEWRLQHPDATLNEIEQALDECWYRVRACLLEDLALQREAAWQAKAADRVEAACAGGRPTCRPPWRRRNYATKAATSVVYHSRIHSLRVSMPQHPGRPAAV